MTAMGLAEPQLIGQASADVAEARQLFLTGLLKLDAAGIELSNELNDTLAIVLELETVVTALADGWPHSLDQVPQAPSRWRAAA